MKTAILQVADTGPLESLVVMLRSVGYECYLPDDGIKAELRGMGCDCVLDVEGLVENWGYARPISLPIANKALMQQAHLYVDVKAHKNAAKVWSRWPNLREKTLWYRINGGEPEHVVKRDDGGNVIEDHGDERNPPCPVLTPNMWYKDDTVKQHSPSPLPTGTLVDTWAPWVGRAYACWPPFHRFDDYYTKHGRSHLYDSPVCLIHNLVGWGYSKLIDRVRELGVKFHGRGSPDGLVQHGVVSRMLHNALAMVHLKSSDAPGYALYEGLAAGCPLVVSRRLIWRNRMRDLLIPEQTCLVFDRETHEGLTDQDVDECELAIGTALNRLRDPVLNERIGMAGREQLQKVMWSTERAGDVQSLREFMERHFG